MAAAISVGTAYGEAAAFVRRERRLIAPLVLALLVVPVTLSGLVQPNDPFRASQGLEPWMAVAFAALLAQLVGQMALSRLAMGWDGSLGQALSLSLKRLPAAVGAFLIFFLCIGLILIPLTIVVMVAGGGARTGTSIGLANVLAFLALLFAAPRIMLAPALATAQAGGPWALVKSSVRLAQGRYWRLLGFFLLFLFASLILAQAVTAVVGSLAAVALGPPGPMTVSRLCIALAGGVVQGVAGTLYAVMLGRLTVNLPSASTKGM